MEKGFNDDELADIMSEIENLEREFSDEAAPAQAAADPVMHELAHKPVEQTVLKTNHDESKVLSMKSAPSTSPASLSFKVEGQMTMHLSFDVNGQSVSLSVSDEGLSIQTDSGAKFTLPLKHEAAKKAA